MTKSSALLASLLAISAISAHAEPVGDILAANNEVGVSLVRTTVDYHELDSTRQFGNAYLDSEAGSVPGYALSVSVMRDLWLGNDYLAMGSSHVNGSTAYTGGYIQGGTYHPTTATSGATLSDMWARAGRGFFVSEAAMVTPYAELGSHTWNRYVGQSSPMGYPETYKHRYAGAGLMMQYVPMDNLVVSGDVLLGHTFSAAITTPHMSGASLGSSAMYRMGLGLDYRVYGNAHLTASVNWTHFDYGQSAVQPSGYFEPDSQTTNRTLQVGFAYGF